MRKTSHLCGRYILQLISPNDVPNEEYHYDSLSEAENHFSQICSLDNDDYFMAQNNKNLFSKSRDFDIKSRDFRNDFS